MKTTRKLLALAMTLSLLASAIYPMNEAVAAKKKATVSKVAFTNVEKSLVLKKGASITLKTQVSVKPNTKANKKVSFRSNKPKVVSVTKKGKCKALKSKGTAKITATSNVNKKKKATVTIRIGRPVTSIKLSKTSLTLLANGDAVSLSATVKPSNASVKKVTWTSSNENVVSVSFNGSVVPLEGGKANVTATATDGSKKKAVCKVTVQSHDEYPYDWKTTPSLKDLYSPNFLIGMGISGSNLTSGIASSIVRYHFNSVTMENEMKPDVLLDWQGSEENAAQGSKNTPAIKFNVLDTYLSYAQKNNMKMRFHTLVWHSQTPKWFFSENFENGAAYVDKDSMAARMNSYITQIVNYTETKYPGVIYAWDVVNEAISHSPSEYEMIDNIQYRKSSSDGPNPWFAILGRDHINLAFKYTKDALKAHGSTAKLFYNDFNTYDKPTSIKNMVLYVNKDEKLCDGIGMQSHVSLNYPSLDKYEKALQTFVEIGQEVHVTELDIDGLTYSLSILENNPTSRDSLFEKQAQAYRAYFDLFKKYPGQVTSVTVWGINDGGGNWKSNDAPFLFNYNFTPKPAFWAIATP